VKRLCVLLLLLVPFGRAVGAEVVSWIGTRERVIDGRPIDIPLDLAVPPLDPKAPSVIQVTASGREVNATAVTASLLQRNHQWYLHVGLDAAAFARSGTYLVKIRIPAKDTFTASLAELTLTRPAGDLSVAVPMRTERVIYAPFLLDCWYPRRWPLDASGQDVAPTARERIIAFNGPNQKPIGSKVKLAFPSSVAAGKQNDVTLESTASFPLGTSTGKVVIDAPQLAKPFESAFEVISRVWRGWLLITIAASIVLGHFVRNKLERRRLRALAMAGAGEQLAELVQLAKSTADDDFKGEIDTAASQLEAATDDKDSNLENAMKTAKAAVDAIRTRMAAAQTKAETDLKALRASIGDPAMQLNPVRLALQESAQDVADAQKNLGAGQLGRATADAERIAEALPKRLEEARLPWSDLVHKVAAKSGTWPESPANEALQQAVAAAAKAPPIETMDAATKFVQDARTVTGNLRDALFAIVSGARDLAGRMAAELVPFQKEQDVAARLDALSQLRNAPIAADVEALAAQASALRAAIAAALTSVVPQNTPASIGEGNFAQGLADVLSARKGAGKALGDAAAPFLHSARIAESAAAPASASNSPIPATLVLEDEAVVGRALRVRLQVEDLSLPAAAIVVTWYRGDERLHTAPAGDLVLRYRPADAEPAIIRADFTAGARTGSASRHIVARPPRVVDPAAWRRISRSEEWKQTLVAGAFILLIGYLIFADAFLGTPAQFLAAALWGFMVDVTLPKLMALAAPVAAKTPTLG
jgi:hypothetical protein